MTYVQLIFQNVVQVLWNTDFFLGKIFWIFALKTAGNVSFYQLFVHHMHISNSIVRPVTLVSVHLPCYQNSNQKIQYWESCKWFFCLIGICEMQRNNTQQRIEALIRERRRIKTSIDQLKEKLSKRRVNVTFPQKETYDFESR